MRYLLTRASQMLIILALLSVALFGLLSAMPGNPVDLLITSNPRVKPEDVVRLKKLRGLDKPWYVQYVRWLWGYPDPARPPMIKELPKELISSKQEFFEFDLKSYISDPNFIPTKIELKNMLTLVWQSWDKSSHKDEIEQALSSQNISSVLMLAAKHNNNTQKKLKKIIEDKSVDNLRLVGLFGAQVKKFKISKKMSVGESSIWFKVINTYDQESLGRINLTKNNLNIIKNIDPQIVKDENRVYELDLNKFLISNNLNKVDFVLLGNSVGKISQNKFTHKFDQAGQSIILAQAQDKINNLAQNFAFVIEHGVIGHQTKFNPGFLFFFVGNREALGFSNTYKRPVYDLLFGAPTRCGDGRVDVGETCDDGNLAFGDGCSPNCFNEQDSIITKADAKASAYIIRSGRIGNTIQLMLPAILLSFLIAIPLGVFSAYRQYSVLDYIVNFFAFIGISLPVFWFGIMMIYLFAENLQLFPAGGVQTPGIYGQGTWEVMLDRLKHAILPTMVLSIFYVGRWLRYMRASMLEILPKDYVRTARAKGLSEWTVILKHAFRNALIPVVTVLALSIPSLFGGAVLTETIFSWPGVGRLQYDAVMSSDYYVAIIVFLVSAVLVMLGNLLADLLYVLVDPRIRKQ